MRKRFCVIGAAAALCGLVGPASAADISVSAAWFRSMPSGQPAGGYFMMTNKGRNPVALVAAESPACEMLMLHRTVSGNGTSRMDDVNSVDLSVGKTVSFAPGGYHLMCMSPSTIMMPGQFVPVTFVFSDGKRLRTNFAVRNAAGN